MPFTCRPKRGFFLEFAKSGRKSRFRHVLGGPNECFGAWCLNCHRPLLLLLSLDTGDPSLGLALPRGRAVMSMDFNPARPAETTFDVTSRRDLPLFYCWHCHPSLTYRLNPSGGVDPLDNDPFGHNAGPHEPDKSDAPYDDYPESLPPAAMKLRPIPDEVQSIIHRGNHDKLAENEKYGAKCSRWLRPRHQVGGEPFFSQRNVIDGGVTCPLCGREMPLIASVADDAGGGRHFVNDSFVHVLFHWCEPCQVVHATHECD
jgi:hypothetical protein